MSLYYVHILSLARLILYYAGRILTSTYRNPCLCPFSDGVQGNRGTDFIILVPHGTSDDSTQLHITTPVFDNVTVFLSTAHPTMPRIEQSITVTEGISQVILIPGQVTDMSTTQPLGAVRVTSTDSITIVVLNDFGTCSGYLAIPTISLGKEYRLATWGISSYSILDFVATEDDTMVYVSIPVNVLTFIEGDDGVVHGPGETLIVTLDELDAYHIHSGNDLSELAIRSDKPISLYGGNQNAKIGAGSRSDHVLTQFSSLETWGYRFSVPSSPTSSDGYYVKCISRYDATIYIGSSDYAVEGGKYTLKKVSDNNPTFITSTSPLLVVLYATSTSDSTAPAALYIQPEEQLPTEYYFTIPDHASTRYYITVSVMATESANIYINDDLFLPDSWDVVDGNVDLVNGYMEVSPGTYRLNQEYVKVPFWASIYGFGDDSCAFALPAGMNYNVSKMQQFHLFKIL